MNRRTGIYVFTIFMVFFSFALNVSCASAENIQPSFQKFISDPRWSDGTSWGGSQRPKLNPLQSYMACAAYCADFVMYNFGISDLRGGTVFYDTSQIRAGDIIHIDGHWFACLKRLGKWLYVAEGNVDSQVRIGWNWTIKDSKYFDEDSRPFLEGYHYMADTSPSIPTTGNSCGYNVKYAISGNTINFSKINSGAEAVWGADCADSFKDNRSVTVMKINDTIRIIKTRESKSNGALFGNIPYVQEMYLSKLDVSAVTNMYNLFRPELTSGKDGTTYNTSLKKLDLGGWNTSNVTNMDCMFWGCSSLTSLNVSGWDTSNVTNMKYMFCNCSSLTKLDLNRWNTSKVTEMSGMFDYCNSLTSLNVSGWNTSKVTDMESMFFGCSSLTSLDLNRWNTSKVTNMNYMFDYCTSLTNLDLSRWNTSNVKKMNSMFSLCTSLTDLNLSGWNTSSVTEMNYMFNMCRALQTLCIGKNSLNRDIFTSLPAYNDTWYYFSAGTDAGNPLPLDSSKTNGSLFTAYNYNTMAGTWTTAKDKGKLINDFISRSYQYILGRKADQSGVSYYSALLRNGKLTGAQMVMNFVNSPEFQGKKYSNEKVVEILYRTMMDRTADANGRAYWAGFLNDGLSQKYVVQGFAVSTEFKNICSSYGIKAGTIELTENRDKNGKVTQFISRNYRIALGRKGDANGLNYWTGMILNKKQTPQQVAFNFVFSKECVNKNLNNTEFVKMLYRLYMGREFDQSGLNYWIVKMKNGMSRQNVAKSFGGSKEFKEIVASYGL